MFGGRGQVGALRRQRAYADRLSILLSWSPERHAVFQSSFWPTIETTLVLLVAVFFKPPQPLQHPKFVIPYDL